MDPVMQEISVQEAVKMGATSLRAFGKLFFPKTFRQESPQFHDEIGKALYSTARYNAFEIFRDGAKTSLLRVYTAQRVAYAISRTIMYVSVSQSHAIYSLRWLKRAVERNQPYTSTFGLKKGTKWTDEVMEIHHQVEDVPITVLAMGVTGQIRGFNIDDYRPDLIIIDDVLNEENTATPEQRQKMENLLFGALLNSLAPASEAPLAKAVFLQTPLNKEDAIEKVMRDDDWHGFRFGVFDEKGESRWPARWSTELLKKEKENAIRNGRYKLWMREKECKLVAGDSQALDTNKLVFYDELPKGCVTVISIDPASSESKTADDNVVMCVAFKGQEVYIADYHAAKGVMPDQAASQFFELALRYRVLRGVVETVSYQRTLAWYIEQEMMKRRVFVPIDKIQDKRKKSDRIMQAIVGLLSYRHIHVRASMTEFIDQMDDYSPDAKEPKDDMLDALAMAITAMTPYLRAQTYDGEFERLAEDSFKEIEFRGCP